MCSDPRGNWMVLTGRCRGGPQPVQMKCWKCLFCLMHGAAKKHTCQHGDALKATETQLPHTHTGEHPCSDIQACAKRQEKSAGAYTGTHLEELLRSLRCDHSAAKQRSLVWSTPSSPPRPSQLFKLGGWRRGRQRREKPSYLSAKRAEMPMLGTHHICPLNSGCIQNGTIRHTLHKVGFFSLSTPSFPLLF